MYKISKKKSAIFNEKIDIRERCKGVHCVDLGESCPTNIYLQNLAARSCLLASIQPRTSPTKTIPDTPIPTPPPALKPTLEANQIDAMTFSSIKQFYLRVQLRTANCHDVGQRDETPLVNQ